MVTDWNGIVKASRHDYAQFYKSNMGELVLDDLPNKYGGSAKRRQSTKDVLTVNNGGLLDGDQNKAINPNQYVLWNGDNDPGLVSITRCFEDKSRSMRYENGMSGKKVKLHPVEVRITPFAVHQMRSVSRKVCGQNPRGDHEQMLETGGFLGGMPMQDSHGRWYTEIYFAYADENLRGTETDFTFEKELQRLMDNDIAMLGHHRIGFWHSHPTYGPFQSDERLQPYGADVQATHRFCRAWWSVALVIDAHDGPNKDTVSLGAYKINGNHESLSEDDSDIVGWRSVGIGIKPIRTLTRILEDIKNKEMSAYEKEELEFELNMMKFAATNAVKNIQGDDLVHVRNIQQLLSSERFPLIPKLTEKEAKELYNQVKTHDSKNSNHVDLTVEPPNISSPDVDPYGGVNWHGNTDDVVSELPLLPTDEEIKSSKEVEPKVSEEE